MSLPMTGLGRQRKRETAYPSSGTLFDDIEAVRAWLAECASRIPLPATHAPLLTVFPGAPTIAAHILEDAEAARLQGGQPSTATWSS
jgi:hypothetical protein